MPSVLGHALTGLTLAAALPQRDKPADLWFWAAVAPVAPDADVLAFAFGIPYEDMLGHRGLSHSLLIAAVIGPRSPADSSRRGGHGPPPRPLHRVRRPRRRWLRREPHAADRGGRRDAGSGRIIGGRRFARARCRRSARRGGERGRGTRR